MFSELYLTGCLGLTTGYVLYRGHCYRKIIAAQSRTIQALKDIEWYATQLVDSTNNAVHVLHGGGFRRYVKIRDRFNPEATAFVEVGDVNPRTMEIIQSASRAGTACE